MPTLEELKSKWFIKMDGSAPDGVPWRRHTEPTGGHGLAVSTDGNLVIPIIDGKELMKAWHSSVLALHGVSGAELYLTGWRLDAVKPLGESSLAGDALQILDEAGENGVSVRVLLSDHLAGLNWNTPSSIWLLAHVVTTMMDSRYPVAGSNHFKCSVFKSPAAQSVLLGSADIAKTRWDDSFHLAENSERSSDKPTHELGVLVQGPAVRDLELAFRERWNDPGYSPIFPKIETPISAPAAVGTHSVQVLRTYGVAANMAYSWSPRGEFTVWASYLNAIKKAKGYIYIEDQFFLPFDWPPAFARSCGVDLFFQLGEVMKRGVRILVVVPKKNEELQATVKYQRDVGVNYLLGLKKAGVSGDVVVASLKTDAPDVFVHSKLMIVDDELVLLGSANFSRRSMACDGEIQLSIVDAASMFARSLRAMLWSEHLGRPLDVEDPVAAYGVMATAVAERRGRLEPYPVEGKFVYPQTAESQPPGRTHSVFVRNLLDPYYGPKGLL